MSISPLLADWRVLIRDASGAIKDEIDDWLTSGGGLTAEPTFNGVGAFTLSMASNGISARIIDETCGIVLVRNDVIVFSGQIRTLVRTGADITCTGLADEYLLQRPALPDPLGPPFTTPYNVVTGQASAVLRQLLFNNLSLPYCRPDRAVANLLFQAVDPALGGTITGRADGGDLLDLVAKLAAVPAAGGLGIKIRQTSMTASTRTISIYQPVDRSADVQFGVDYGTASDFEDTRSAPEASMWYAMGGDGLTLDKRTVLYDSNPTLLANWGLIEKFADFRDITNPTELAAQLQSLLARSTAARKVTVTPFETTSLQFVDHWNVGDVVTFVGPDGVPFVDVIRSARIVMGADGVRVTPTVAEAGSSNNQLIAQHLASVQDRLSNIERNWTVPDSSITRAMLTDFVKPPIGQVVPFAGTTPPTGWLLCQGQSLLRTSYPDLFGVIGGAYGVADGLHFNLPDARGRAILGVSGSHALGSTGGSETATPPPHTHPGSHSHGVGVIAIAHDHSGPAHTHPGLHSHGMNNHNHLTDINHDHPSQIIHSGIVQETGSGGGADLDTTVALTHGGSDRVARQFHTHDVTVDISALGTASTASGNQSSGGNSTQTDNNVFAATFTANTGAAANITNSGTTDPDSNAPAASYSGTIATLPPFIAMNYIIFSNAA